MDRYPSSIKPERPAAILGPGRFDAVLLDLDGVLTSTAKIHAECWKEIFDDFLKMWAARRGEPFCPFDADRDYRLFVDGKSREDGVRSFLASRGIALPEGAPDSPAEEDSVYGLGKRKNELVRRAIQAGRAKAFPGSVRFVRWIRDRGLRTAVVSSSHNCLAVLRSTGIGQLFEVTVDGYEEDRLHLRGKPAPDAYLHAAELLRATPARSVVVEDAIAGVQSGRAGGFGLVVGVDRGGAAKELRRNGADLVVSDLGQLIARRDHERQ